LCFRFENIEFRIIINFKTQNLEYLQSMVMFPFFNTAFLRECCAVLVQPHRFGVGPVAGCRLLLDDHLGPLPHALRRRPVVLAPGYERSPDFVKLFAEIVVQPTVQQRIGAGLSYHQRRGGNSSETEKLSRKLFFRLTDSSITTASNISGI
jgi:hypothetical protein